LRIPVIKHFVTPLLPLRYTARRRRRCWDARHLYRWATLHRAYAPSTAPLQRATRSLVTTRRTTGCRRCHARANRTARRCPSWLPLPQRLLYIAIGTLDVDNVVRCLATPRHGAWLSLLLFVLGAFSLVRDGAKRATGGRRRGHAGGAWKMSRQAGGAGWQDEQPYGFSVRVSSRLCV